MEDLKAKVLHDLLGAEDIELSDDQEHALATFLRFLNSKEDRAAFLLTGSAGTGKTFLINIFSRLMKKMGSKVILLAPTGRAAKVITRRTQRLAYTIHHHIYTPVETGFGGVSFRLKQNKETNRVIYVVDEASMIGSKGDESSHSGLLQDLLRFVFDNDESRKIILVGDPVQLPPVGHSDSPALNPRQLEMLGDVRLFHAHLEEVKRQLVDSEVLEQAVTIRDAYLSGNHQGLEIQAGREVQRMDNAYEALETYMGYYREGDLDRAVFLTYSNYQATRVNQAIRHQLFHTEEKLIPSDVLMVVRNNYTWGDSKRLPFIANGEMGTVRHVFGETREEKYGLNWVNAEIEFYDHKGEVFLVECKLMLDLLDSKQSQIEQEQLYSIYQERRQEYMGLSPSKAATMLNQDPYINALQVKYGYAITGHKSQGGQWDHVVIGFEPDYGQNLQAYVRWTYTAFTRAVSHVFLLNCPFMPE